MTLRFDSFLTPFASPALGRIDVSGLEDAARMLEQRAQYDQSREDRLAKEAKDYALQQQHQKGLDEYYSSQAATHRMQVEQAKNADLEKRSRALFDAFRKSKTPNERRAIADELQRLGFTVEEQDTALPAPPAAPGPAAAQPPATPMAKAPKAGKTPKPNAGFMSALGQVVADENAQEAPVDESTLGKGSFVFDPALGAMSGEVPAASAGGEIAAPPATPSRGGRFVIKDKSGVPVHSFDEPMEKARVQSIAASMFSGYRDAATNDRELKAADAAVQAATNVFLSGGDANQAAQAGDRAYKANVLQEHKRTYPQGKGTGGAPAGPSKIGLRMQAMDREQTDKIIRRVDKDGDAKKQIDGINMARRAISSLDAGSGIGDLDAFKSYLVQMSGKVVTDKEMDQFMHSEGAWVGWEKKFNEYAAQGRFPDEFKRPLRAMFDRFIKLNTENLHNMASNAREQARLSGLSENDQAIVSGHFTGEFPTSGGKSGGGADTRSDEDLIKAWKAGAR